MLRLVTIPISHYCEKARWALERAGLAYVEEPHVQVLHRLYARRAGGGLTVPVLVTPQGSIGDSSQILAWVDGRLGEERRLFADTAPARREALDLCRRFDEQLGPCGRRLVYIHMFAQREKTLEINNQGVPSWEDRALRFGWPLATRTVNRVLGIRPGMEVEDEQLALREFDHVAELLADGRPYLLGERFGAADLTFACMAAPLLVPLDYGVRLPQPEELDSSTAGMVLRAREHPAGRWAMQVIAQHRRDRVPELLAS
jgi:glutathione S-transferase